MERVDFRHWRTPHSSKMPKRLALLTVLLHECPTASDLETFLVGTVWPYYRPDGSRPKLATRDVVNAWDRIRLEWRDIMHAKRTRAPRSKAKPSGAYPLVGKSAKRPLSAGELEARRIAREREKDLRWLERDNARRAKGE
jgi:hypothetical protein